MREQNLGKLNFTLKFNLQLTPITTIKTWKQQPWLSNDDSKTTVRFLETHACSRNNKFKKISRVSRILSDRSRVFGGLYEYN